MRSFEDILAAQVEAPAALSAEVSVTRDDASREMPPAEPDSRVEAKTLESRNDLRENVKKHASDETSSEEPAAIRSADSEASKNKDDAVADAARHRPMPVNTVAAMPVPEKIRPESPEGKAEPAGKKTRATDPLAALQERILNIQVLISSLQESVQGSKEVRQALHELKDALLKKPEKNGPGSLEELFSGVKALLKRMDSGADPALSQGLKILKEEAVLLADAAKAQARRTDRTSRDGGRSDTDIMEQRKNAPERTVFVSPGAKDESRESRTPGKDGAQAGLQFQFMKGGPHADRHSAAPQLPKAPLFDEQMQTLMQNARLTVRDARNGSFSLRLHPESLGRVNVNLGLEQGTLNGRFLVENAEVKQALMEQIPEIRRQLEDAGIAVGEFQVNVRDESRRPFNREGAEAHPRQGSFPRANAPARYEVNSVRSHDGAIDMII